MKNYPNILIVRGTSRNVGKTYLSCALIRKLAGHSAPVGVKISPHFHQPEPHWNIRYQKEGLVIVEEESISGKDSSLMLQAGAAKVYYVQAVNQKLPEVLDFLMQEIGNNNPVIIESGGLYDYAEPGMVINIRAPRPKYKLEQRTGSRAIDVSASEEKQNFAEMINFSNGTFDSYA